jgi:hypothetical protein
LNTLPLASVEAAMLQNRPTSRFLVESRRTTCTQRNTIRLSIAGISPLPSAGAMKSSGLSRLPSSWRSRASAS